MNYSEELSNIVKRHNRDGKLMVIYLLESPRRGVTCKNGKKSINPDFNLQLFFFDHFYLSIQSTLRHERKEDRESNGTVFVRH